MKITYTPQSIFDVVIVDTIGPLHMSEKGNKYAVTIICDFSKFLVCVPIENKEATTVAKAIFEDFILIYGLVREIRTDCGTEYKNKLNEELCKMLNIKHNFTVPYRHESVGSIERNHRFFNQYFRSYIVDSCEWEEYLKYFTFCYNTSPHSSFNNKFSPYQLVYNREPNVPSELINEVSPIYNFDNYVHEARYRLQIAHKEANRLLVKAKEANKHFYDVKNKDRIINIGDRVYVESLPYDKHRNVNQGPYVVIDIEEPNFILEDKDKAKKKVHKNQLRI